MRWSWKIYGIDYSLLSLYYNSFVYLFYITQQYKPRFFDEPEYLSSDKENIPPTESVTPPSLKNLSLEEGMNDNENEATSWEASVARNIMTTPRASSPYPNQPSRLED